MSKHFFFVALLTVIVFKATGQTHNYDTYIDGKFYSYVEYYKNGTIKTLGNYSDTIKTGDWIYFTKNGKKLAYGQYKDNHKFGVWTYHNKKNIYKIKWTEKNKPNESFEYDKKGNLIIIDMVFSSPCFHIYTNGLISMTARTM
jgi:antitoxin component YwqK of YwqJK toxin-antitoxin module